MRRFGKLPLSVRELFFFLFFCICLRTIAESLISTAFQSYLCNNVFPDIHLVLWSFFCYFECSLARFFFFAQWFSYFGRFRRKTSHGQMQLLSSKARSTMLTSGARAAAYRKKEVAWQYHGNHVKKSCLLVSAWFEHGFEASNTLARWFSWPTNMGEGQNQYEWTCSKSHRLLIIRSTRWYPEKRGHD